MKKILFIIFFFLIGGFTAQSQCHVADYKALRALYYSTNGDNWKNKTNWDIQSVNPPPTCDLSRFQGVILNSLGRVQLINLGQNNLTGTLPVEIGQLEFLNTLWLNQNAITGSVPKEFGELQKLERLALSYNQFSGTLPPEIFSIKTIKEFSLEVNKFEGGIPNSISNFTNVTRIDLSRNNLSGTLPKEIGELKTLGSINLSHNNFEGCFPETFKSLCTKTTNFDGNNSLANWQSFCKSPSECKFNFKEVEFELDTLVVSQSAKKKQFIFISEGFTKAEFPKFRSFVEKATSKLKEHFPGISFEVLLAYVPSNQSGVSHTSANPPILKDTYFETDLRPNGFGDPAVFIKEEVAGPFIAKYFPESKFPLSSRILTYVVNSEIYGAYAGAAEGVSVNKTIGVEINTGTLKDAEWVLAHELGHFFGLADIQDGHVTPQGEWANATREINRDKIKWRQYIKPTTPVPTPKNSGYDKEIGLFSVNDKSGSPTGWYRPCNDNCIMRTPSSHGNFCLVCGGHLNRNDNLPFLKVENGNIGGYYIPGNRITVKANPPEKSKVFSHWEGEGIIFENNLLSEASFIMPNKNVNVRAVFKDIVLGFEPIDTFENFQVFPNPSIGMIKIIFNEPLGKPVKLNLINSMGHVVKEWFVSEKENIFQIFDLSSGIYILKFEMNEKVEYKKLIKL